MAGLTAGEAGYDDALEARDDQAKLVAGLESNIKDLKKAATAAAKGEANLSYYKVMSERKAADQELQDLLSKK